MIQLHPREILSFSITPILVGFYFRLTVRWVIRIKMVQVFTLYFFQ